MIVAGDMIVVVARF